MGVEVLIGISLVSNALSINETRKGYEAQKEAGEIQRGQQQVDAQRMRRSEARKARVRRAQIEQASESTGTGGSSGEAGALGSVFSRQAAQIGALSGMELSATAISTKTQQAAEARFKSSLYQAVGNLASQAASLPMGGAGGGQAAQSGGSAFGAPINTMDYSGYS